MSHAVKMSKSCCEKKHPTNPSPLPHPSSVLLSVVFNFQTYSKYIKANPFPNLTVKYNNDHDNSITTD